MKTNCLNINDFELRYNGLLEIRNDIRLIEKYYNDQKHMNECPKCKQAYLKYEATRELMDSIEAFKASKINLADIAIQIVNAQVNKMSLIVSKVQSSINDYNAFTPSSLVSATRGESEVDNNIMDVDLNKNEYVYVELKNSEYICTIKQEKNALVVAITHPTTQLSEGDIDIVLEDHQGNIVTSNISEIVWDEYRFIFNDINSLGKYSIALMEYDDE